MVMYLRGMTPDYVATDDQGDIMPNESGTIHSTPGGPIYTNTFACNTETMEVGDATGGIVTTDSVGRFAFYTEDYAGPLWLFATGRWWMMPVTDNSGIITAAVADAVAPFSADIASAEATATAADGKADTALAENATQDTELADLSDRIDLVEARVNVLNYGALGDGVTNDQPAFVAAMASIEAVGGGQLYIPGNGRTYVINGVVEMTSNLEIVSDGARLIKTVGSPYAFFVSLSHGTTGFGSGVRNVKANGLTFVGDFDTDMGVCGFALHHAQDVIIENCKFEQAQGTGHCIDLCGCDNVVIRNCDFLGFNNHLTGGFNRTEAIELDASYAAALSFPDDPGSYDLLLSKNVTVDNCRFLPITVSAVTYPCPNPIGAHAQVEGKAYTDIRFTNNYVLNPTQDVPVDAADNGWLVGVLHFPTTQGLWIEGNTFVQTVPRTQRVISVVSMSNGVLASADPDITPPASGAWAAPVRSRDIFIRGNKISGFKPPAAGTETPAIYIRGVTDTAGWIENVHIDSNTIADGYQSTGALGGRAVFVQNASRADVRGCTIASYKYGIDGNVGDTMTVTGCTIDQMYNWPVVLTAWAGAVVNGNALRRLRKPMQSQAGTTEISFVGNTITEPQITGNDAAGIVCAGTRSVVSGNTIRNHSGTQPRGIAMNAATAAFNVVAGNVATGFTTSVTPFPAPADTIYSANNPVPVGP